MGRLLNATAGGEKFHAADARRSVVLERRSLRVALLGAVHRRDVQHRRQRRPAHMVRAKSSDAECQAVHNVFDVIKAHTCVRPNREVPRRHSPGVAFRATLRATVRAAYSTQVLVTANGDVGVGNPGPAAGGLTTRRPASNP